MDAILLALYLKFGLDNAVSTILTVIHHIDQTRRAVLKHIEIMAKQIGLNECLFLGHRGELDLLDADELLVVILGNE